jgi:hypothetical protein
MAALGLAVGLVAAGSSVGGASVSSQAKPKYEYGINTYFTYNCQGTTLIDQWATTQFSEYKALGANAVAIAFPIYTDSLKSNSVYTKLVCNDPNYQSPPASLLAGVVDIAHAKGLQVLLRPLIDQTNLYAQGYLTWRGQLAPTNMAAWFQSYLATMRPFLQVAQAHHVEHFAIESELNSLAHATEWPSAIALSRAIYKGDITFDYSWKTAVAKITPGKSSLGIDTYPPLSKATLAATPAKLTAMWSHLLAVSSSYELPRPRATTIEEVGISAQVGAYAEPWNTVLGLPTHPFDQTVQANWFTAACSFMKQHQMKGIYFWGPWLASKAGNLLTVPTPRIASDIQPAAQTAIKHCFT